MPVTKVSASASRLDPSGPDSGGAEMHNYLGAVALAVVTQELRQRLQLIIQAHDFLGTSGATSWELGLPHESRAVFTGGRMFSFGPFQLFPSQRLLLDGNRRVQIGSRAFDILTILVDRAGEVVGKEELIARVWPNVFVEDSNLKTQVSGLRRALGESPAGKCYIVTVPGRGYNFVASVSFSEGPTLDRPDTRQARGYDHLYDEPQRHEAGSVVAA
jgi:DNA-binding winged helix-turn-helix (wHTH) protein